MRSLRRGAVVLVRFDPAQGSEIRKTRPAVVVSNAAACRFDAVVQVVPLTSLPDRQLRPYESRVESSRSELTKPSRSVCNLVRTISRGRLSKRLGKLSGSELLALDRALAIQLGLNST